LAEFEFVPLVVVESVRWSGVLLGMVVVVDDPPVVVEDPPVVVLVDCAKANPVDNAAMAAALRSRFIVNSLVRYVPSVTKHLSENTVPRKSGGLKTSFPPKASLRIILGRCSGTARPFGLLAARCGAF
jgi:hypothetical protein